MNSEAPFSLPYLCRCILNAGTEPPAIVMGVSGVPSKLLDVDTCKR
jgi:hypothetical protein